MLFVLCCLIRLYCAVFGGGSPGVSPADPLGVTSLALLQRWKLLGESQGGTPGRPPGARLLIHGSAWETIVFPSDHVFFKICVCLVPSSSASALSTPWNICKTGSPISRSPPICHLVHIPPPLHRPPPPPPPPPLVTPSGHHSWQDVTPGFKQQQRKKEPTN